MIFGSLEGGVPEGGDIRVVYAHNPGRAHKILPLLEGVPVVSVRTWRDLLRLRRDAGTLVLIDTFARFGVLGMVASLRLRSPLVVRLRGDIFSSEYERALARPGILGRVRYWGNVSLMRLCLKRARLVIFNSEHLAREMAPYVAKTPTRVVYNPYTPPRGERAGRAAPALPCGGLRLLTVTNMYLYSKVEPTSEAIVKWIPPGVWEELDLHWVVCGGGYHEESLRELVRTKGLEQRVHVLGQVEDVASAYEWCDVLVHLTKMDAFPNTPMEAMMHGKPVITNTDSDGTREQVFDGENGLLVEDAASFVAALRVYAEDPALRKLHGQAGRSLVKEKFSIAAQRRVLQEALRGLFATGRKGAHPLSGGEDW